METLGAINLPSPVKPFCAILVAPGIALADIEDGLQQQFGAISMRSAPFPFTQTSYYEREMGADLRRVYIAFDALIGSAELIPMKHAANRLETEWAIASGDRRVNLDPGYLDLAKVVLASTKDHAHRLYLGAGIYAEITLRYSRKQFQAWDWTYPDYRLATTRAFFERVREQYRRQLAQRAVAAFKR